LFSFLSCILAAVKFALLVPDEQLIGKTGFLHYSSDRIGMT